MSRNLLAPAALLALLGLPTVAAADFQNMAGGMYMQTKDDNDLSLSWIGILGSHYLSKVDTSSLALEAPFMQRTGFVSVAVAQTDGDIATDLPVDGNIVFGESMIPLTADLFMGLNISRQDLTLDTSAFAGSDVHARQSMIGLKLGYYIAEYTTLSLEHSASSATYDNPALSGVSQDTTSIRAETLLFNAGGHSFKFGAEVGKNNARGADDSDSFGVSIRYFPLHTIGVEIGMEQVKYDVDTTPDEKTLSAGFEAYIASRVFVSISYDSTSESGPSGVDGDSLMIMAAGTF